MLTNRRQSDSGHNKVLYMSVEIEWSLWLLTQFCRLIRKWLESKGMVVTVRVELLAHGLRMKYPREPKLNFCSVHSSRVLLPQFHPRTCVTTRDNPNHCRCWIQWQLLYVIAIAPNRAIKIQILLEVWMGNHFQLPVEERMIGVPDNKSNGKRSNTTTVGTLPNWCHSNYCRIGANKAIVKVGSAMSHLMTFFKNNKMAWIYDMW